MPNKYSGALGFINDIGSLPSLDDGMPKPDPMNQRIPKFEKPKAPRGITEETSAGIVLPESGAELQPDIQQQPYRPGLEDDDTSWNQEVTRQPVYEYDGMRIVGDLQWAPEWPQDLQPVDWVIVPVNGTEWKQS